MKNKMLLYYITPYFLHAHASESRKWANNKTGEIVFKTEQPREMEFLGYNADFTVKEPQNNEIVCSGIVAHVTYYLRRRLTDRYQTWDFIGDYLNSYINSAKRNSLYDVLQDKGKYIEELQNIVIKAEKEIASATIFNYLDNDSNKLIKGCCNNYIERVKSILRELEPTTKKTDTTITEPINKEIKKPQINEDLKRTIENAIKAGYCSFTEEGYKWNGTGVQLAMFAVIAKDRKYTKTKWADIERLFNEKNLVQANNRLLFQHNYNEISTDIEELFY